MLQFKDNLACLRSDQHSEKLFLKICVRSASKSAYLNVLRIHYSIYVSPKLELF